LLVAVDPGDWATNSEAGSGYGYGLLFVVMPASLAAMLLQAPGIVTDCVSSPTKLPLA
jgi:Mn2+/Fe2+ NRAMP family transporter